MCWWNTEKSPTEFWFSHKEYMYAVYDAYLTIGVLSYFLDNRLDINLIITIFFYHFIKKQCMNASDTYKNLQFTVHDIYVHF